MSNKPKLHVLSLTAEESIVYPFSEEEYRRGIALKNNKAAGIDDVLVEQLKNLGPKTHKWLLAMLFVVSTHSLDPCLWGGGGVGSPIISLLVHQPAYLSIWPAAPSLQRGLSTNPGVTMWCICGCS